MGFGITRRVSVQKPSMVIELEFKKLVVCAIYSFSSSLLLVFHACVRIFLSHV